MTDGLSPHDMALIDKARRLHYLDWYVTIDLEEQAQSPKAREIIHDIGSRLYHRDEYNHDMI